MQRSGIRDNIVRFQRPPCAGVVLSARGLLDDGIEHLRDEALLGFGQPSDAFELLLQLGRWAAFAA